MPQGKVLWRVLTQTDFNAMHGVAKETDTGGGAMHIALGVNTNRFPISGFLPAGAGSHVEITTEEFLGIPGGQLTFDGNPARRGGEWRIADQRSGRHPAWQSEHGFPTEYDATSPPVIFVWELGGQYKASYLDRSDINNNYPSIVALMGGKTKGIATIDEAWEQPFTSGGSSTTLADYESALNDDKLIEQEEPYDPASQEDGRQKTLAEIVRRQGQQKFRKELLEAYQEQCCITNGGPPFVLEAAHITPYLGPETNSVTNGLLLRADIHTLWDLALISINPDSMKIVVSNVLADTDYSQLDGNDLTLPLDSSKHPSEAALRTHYNEFEKNQGD